MIERTIEALAKRLPRPLRNAAKRFWRSRKKARAESAKPLTEERLLVILREELGVARGDVVFVHAAVEALNLEFPFFRVLPLLREAIGEEGTMVFPTYPKHSCYRFLGEGEVFDARKSPSFTGILSEFARRQKGGVRSLQPTKSVVAIGPAAAELTATHHESPRPYDIGSPYHKLMNFRGKIIGLGAETRYLSFVHCVEDALKAEHPVFPYHPILFHARCIDSTGNERIVPAFAHDLDKLDGRALMTFLEKHIPASLCEEKWVDGMRFFRADTVPLFERMCELAREGHTTFPRRAYVAHPTTLEERRS